MKHDGLLIYMKKWWNITTAIMLALFVLAAILWIVGFAKTGGWSVVNYSPSQFAESKDGYQLLLLGNSFFSVAIVASVFYLFDLCQVRSQRCFLVCSILQNNIFAMFSLVCPPSGNMARKQCFLVFPLFGNMAKK